MILAGPHARPLDRTRFRFEAEAVAALQHTHIVQLYEVGEAEGCPYLAMELVEGGNLAQRIQEQPFGYRAAADLVRALALAADHAHRRGVLHRDLKPGNVLLTADGQPKITDFGLAKRLQEGPALTATGQVCGTPSYMAPEQAQGRTRDVGPATDVYALGAILYELLTCRPPFVADTPLRTLLLVTEQEPAIPSSLRPKVPRDLETICLKCLAKEPARRYASAEGLADDLHFFLNGKPVRARPVSVWERSVKWARRHPAAALIALTLCAAVLAVQGLILWYNTRLESSLQQTQIERDKANDQERLTRRGLYAAQMHLAQQALEQGQVGAAVVLLDSQRPKPEDTEDLRGFEWYHLWQRTHQERALLFDAPVRVFAARWSASGLRLAIVNSKGAISIWDAAAPSAPNTLPKLVFDLPVSFTFDFLRPTRVALSPDGRLVAVADGSLRLWDIAAGAELFAGQWPAGSFRSVAFAPDGTTLAAGAENGIVTLWDDSIRPRLTQVNQYRLHDRSITTLVFSPSGKVLALSGNLPRPGTEWQCRILKVCEVATGKELANKSLPTISDSLITGLEFAPDGKMLVVAHAKPFNSRSSAQLQLLDAGNLKELASRSIPNGGVGAVALSPDGRQLATGEVLGLVRLWQVDNSAGKPALTESGTLFGHRAGVHGLWFALDGGRLVSSADDQTVRLWDNPPRLEPAVLTGKGQPLRALALAPDGGTLATTERTSRLLLWDMTTQQLRADRELISYLEPGSNPSFSPNGKLLAAPQSDSTVKVWEVAGGKLRATLRGHNKLVTGTAFRPDGRLLATASRDRTVKLWDTATWQEKTTLREHTQVAWSVAFSPDGRVLASGDDAGIVRLWDADAGVCLATLDNSGQMIQGLMAIAFTPDGTTLAATSYNAQVRLWRLDNGRGLAFPQRHMAAIVSAVFTPDSQTLITGSKDGTIKIWDVVTRQVRLTLKDHTDQVYGLALTPDGETLVSASEDGTIRLWHAPGYQSAQKERSLR
jgi:WD40 repeat protein